MIKEIVLGFLIGLGKIIPGVSGAMIAISFNIYDKLINSVLKPFKNIKFIITISIGFFLAIVFGSKAIMYFMNNFYFLTMIFFVGLISGGIPKIVDKAYNKFNIKHIIVTLITFSLVMILSLFKSESNISSDVNYPFLIIIGFIEAITMIIPGISGTAVLMIIGYYDVVMTFFNNILNISYISYTIKFAIPFIIGIIAGIFLVSKLINYLLTKYESLFFSGVVGFAISAILIMVQETFVCSISLMTFLLSLILVTAGFIISYKFDK